MDSGGDGGAVEGEAEWKRCGVDWRRGTFSDV